MEFLSVAKQNFLFSNNILHEKKYVNSNNVIKNAKMLQASIQIYCGIFDHPMLTFKIQ